MRTYTFRRPHSTDRTSHPCYISTARFQFNQFRSIVAVQSFLVGRVYGFNASVGASPDAGHAEGLSGPTVGILSPGLLLKGLVAGRSTGAYVSPSILPPECKTAGASYVVPATQILASTSDQD